MEGGGGEMRRVCSCTRASAGAAARRPAHACMHASPPPHPPHPPRTRTWRVEGGVVVAAVPQHHISLLLRGAQDGFVIHPRVHNRAQLDVLISGGGGGRGGRGCAGGGVGWEVRIALQAHIHTHTSSHPPTHTLTAHPPELMHPPTPPPLPHSHARARARTHARTHASKHTCAYAPAHTPPAPRW